MPEANVAIEAQRIIAQAEARHVTLRLIGGIAFKLRCPTSQETALKRTYADIDLVGLRKQTGQIKKLFPELGYTPRDVFNAMSENRLIFNDTINNRQVDIFLSVFEMCHKFDFTERLKLDKLTLPLADLLLTKLQVYEITDREYRDVITLLLDHELDDADEEREKINKKYVAKLCSNDWGLWKTVTLNLDRIKNSLPNYALQQDQRDMVQQRIEVLRKTIESAPKSLKWTMRAKIGEKVRWYELPEADKKNIDYPASEATGKTN